MSRQWMYMADRRSKEFMDGVHEFIEAAEKHKYGGFVRCPCKFCKNEKDYSSSLPAAGPSKKKQKMVERKLTYEKTAEEFFFEGKLWGRSPQCKNLYR